MKNRVDELEFLKEHVGYELEMLSRTRAFAASESDPWKWNAYFESYLLHARNLIDFLTKPSDDKNCVARDFSSSYVPEKMDGKAARIYGRLHDQVLHMGKARTIDPSKKVNWSDAGELVRVIEGRMSAFFEAVDADDAKEQGKATGRSFAEPIFARTLELVEPAVSTIVNTSTGNPTSTIWPL